MQNNVFNNKALTGFSVTLRTILMSFLAMLLLVNGYAMKNTKEKIEERRQKIQKLYEKQVQEKQKKYNNPYSPELCEEALKKLDLIFKDAEKKIQPAPANGSNPFKNFDNTITTTLVKEGPQKDLKDNAKNDFLPIFNHQKKTISYAKLKKFLRNDPWDQAKQREIVFKQISDCLGQGYCVKFSPKTGDKGVEKFISQDFAPFLKLSSPLKLSFKKCTITDKTSDILTKNCKNLKEIWITETKITEEGKEKLKKVIKGLIIHQ